MNQRFERAVAIFLTRAMLGFVYLFAGVQKLSGAPAATLAVGTAAPDPLPLVPGPIVIAIGMLTPFVELGLGALVLVGFRTRPALRCLAALIVSITVVYGVAGLLQPRGATAMDITVVNFYILPRAALLIVTLFLPRDDDLLSVDALIDGRARRWLTGSEGA